MQNFTKYYIIFIFLQGGKTMSKETVFISHGDIILDHIYDENLNLIKQDGGGCNWNDLYNLARMGETCYAIGSCGNDEAGKIAINSLQKSGVNIENIIVEEKSTNIMNIIVPNSKLEDNSVLHSWYDPITLKYTMPFSENLPTTLPQELENKMLYLILDKFLPVNLKFIQNIQSDKKICLDIGHIRFFEHFTKQYLSQFLEFANFVQLNDNVTKLLFERLKVKNEAELFEQFHLDLLISTKGKNGAIFVFKENGKVQTLDLKPEIIVQATDTSGAGDAFFSTVLREYAYAEEINSEFIKSTFKLANQSSREVISQLGSRMKR